MILLKTVFFQVWSNEIPTSNSVGFDSTGTMVDGGSSGLALLDFLFLDLTFVSAGAAAAAAAVVSWLVDSSLEK